MRADRPLISAFPQNRKCQCAVAERRFVPLADSRTATNGNRVSTLYADFCRGGAYMETAIFNGPSRLITRMLLLTPQLIEQSFRFL